MNLLYAAGKGLDGLYTEFINNWLGPIYLIAVAVFSVVFLKDRKFRELFSFIAIATVVALLIFFTKDFFGSKGKVTTNIKGAAEGAL